MPEQIIEKFCKHCKANHPIDDFPVTGYPRKDGTRLRLSVCLIGRRARMKELRDQWTPETRAVRLAQMRKCNNARGPERLAYNQRYAAEHKEQQDEYFRQWRKKKQAEGYFRTDYRREWSREYRLKSKLTVFAAYGGAFCACCSEDLLDTLTIDHMDGKGAEHRRQWTTKQASSQRVYRWLIANNFPPGFQVLCQSCNMGKHLSKTNTCPHQLAVTDLWQTFLDHVAPQQIAA